MDSFPAASEIRTDKLAKYRKKIMDGIRESMDAGEDMFPWYHENLSSENIVWPLQTELEKKGYRTHWDAERLYIYWD